MAMPPVLDRISDYVAHHARAHPAREALVLGPARWSYGRLAEDVDRHAASLLAAGVAKGDRVALFSTPRPECFIGFLATASIGGIALGLNPKFPIEELRYFVADAEPKVLIGHARDAEGDHRAVLAQLAREHACLARTIVLDESGEPETQRFDAWLAAGADVGAAALARARAAVATGDPCLLVYTSGTTGRPKGALIPHRALTLCSAVQAERWSADPLRCLCNLPVNHIGYMGDISSYVLVAGGTNVFLEKFDPAAMLATIERERLTGWGHVPTAFALVLGLPDVGRYDLSSLELVIWGGASMPRALIEAVQRLTGARLATSYGSTETGGSVTYTDFDADLDTLAETVGRPDPRFQVRVADAEGRPVAPGGEGEIQVRGEHVMLGYWHRPEATRDAFLAGGWYRTGDVALLRRDGNLALRGRLSEMYKSGGENVYPREVEAVLEQHPGVALAAVFGVADAVYGEVGRACVVPRPGRAPTPAVLRAFCRERLANFKVPKVIEVRAALPMLPIGKVDKRALRREADALTPVTP
jgi:acyl-CoA synthetase (AMP-forming)/AMP-acid ligase II